MDRDGLMALWEQELRRFSYEPHEAKRYALRLTSGTSGRGPMVSLNKLTPHAISEIAGQGRVVLCFGTRAIRTYNLLKSLTAGLDAFVLDGADLSPSRSAIVSAFEPTQFHGFPSFVLKAAQALPSAVRARVVVVRLVGELLTESMERAFKELFPNAALKSTYAASEIGLIAKPSCGHLPRNQYHPHARTMIAIEEPDDTGSGEIVVSKDVQGMVIDGYRTGDAGRLYDAKCACGETRVLEVLGRVGSDYIKLAGGVLHVEEFDRAMSGFKPTIADYRVEATTSVTAGTLRGKVTLVLYAPTLPTSALQHEIASQVASRIFATPTRTLAQLAGDGLYEPLEVRYTQEPFLQRHKSARLRYVA